MKKTIDLSGRILFIIPIAVFGIFHLMNAKGMIGMVPKYLPGPYFWVYFTGIIHIVAAIFIIGKLKFASLISLGLAILLLFYVLLIHLPVIMGGGSQAQMSLMGALKDISMAGAALYLFGALRE